MINLTLSILNPKTPCNPILTKLAKLPSLKNSLQTNPMMKSKLE